MRQIIIIIGIIIILILGKVFFFAKPDTEKGMGGGAASAPNGGKGGKEMSMPAIPVSIYLAKMEKIDNVVYVSGTILPNEEVELKAEASGRLMSLDLKEGSNVIIGQRIAKLKDTDLQAQLKKLEFEEVLAKQIEDRQKKLLEINAISKEEYEASTSKIKTIGADKEVIRAQIDKTVIKAPFSGKIGLKYISEGAFLSPGTSVATLIQTDPVKIDFTIPEKYSGEIKLGNTIKFSPDGQENANFLAKVVAIDPKVDVNLRTLKIRALAKNSNGKLIPGMFVKVEADLKAQNSIMIPTEAIVPILKGKKVFVLKNGKAKEVLVITGLRTDKKIQVTDGLQTGDSLIVSGIMALKDKANVKVKNVVSEQK